jgi:hypothetical protein
MVVCRCLATVGSRILYFVRDMERTVVVMTQLVLSEK